MSNILIPFFFFGLLCAYLMPAVIANRRRHKNSDAICALNILLGWTFLGWVAALVWSLTDNVDTAPRKPQERIILPPSKGLDRQDYIRIAVGVVLVYAVLGGGAVLLNYKDGGGKWWDAATKEVAAARP